MANDSNARPLRLRYIVVIVCTFLVTACVFLEGYYHFLRTPENVFDEIYWRLVDANCEHAVRAEGGWHYPGEYLYAYLDPGRTSGVVMEGMEWYPIQKRIWGTWLQPIMEEFEGDHNERFERYYGCWKIPFSDMSVTLESGEHVSVDYILVTTKGTSGLLNPDTLYITISLVDVDAKNKLDGDGWCNLIVDLSSRTIDWRVLAPAACDDDQVLSAMKDVLFDVFLPAYFEANPDSNFSMDDLGEWSWGEDIRDY